MKLVWQSKLVLLIVLPFAGGGRGAPNPLVGHAIFSRGLSTVGLSVLLALVVFKLRAATPAAAFTGAIITISLMFSTATFPYRPWQTALVPVLAVPARLTPHGWAARKKERLGTAEKRQGRSAAQVAANLGMAALASSEVVQSWLTDSGWFTRAHSRPCPCLPWGWRRWLRQRRIRSPLKSDRCWAGGRA